LSVVFVLLATRVAKFSLVVLKGTDFSVVFLIRLSSLTEHETPTNNLLSAASNEEE